MIEYSGGKHYEIFIDNVILFLEQIDRNKDVYTSIFDSPILKEFKDLYDEYGTVTNMCLFWEIDQGVLNRIPESARDFRLNWNLSDMTDNFKKEFQENSHWLRFNFHSWNGATEYGWGAGVSRNLGEDYVRMRTEVTRFAGEDSWIDFRSKMHSYSATLEQQQQIRAEGVRVLVGAPMHTNYNNYAFTEAEKNLLQTQGELYKPETGILYSVSSVRVENITLGDALGVGDPMNMYLYFDEFVSGIHDTWKKSPLDFMSVESHEYCYWYDKAVFDGFSDTARWMKDNGYTSAFYTYKPKEELLFESKLDYRWGDPKNWVSPIFV